MRKFTLAVVLLLGAALAARETGIFPILKSTARIGRQEQGFYLLPTNQLLRPWGEQAVISGRPVDLAFDSKHRILAVLNTRSVILLDGSTGTHLAEVKLKPTSYTGIAFRPGDRELWVSETMRNGPDGIAIIPLNELGMPGEVQRIELYGHPLPAGIAFSPDGKRGYVAFSRKNSLAVVDASARAVIKEVPTGVAPFGVAVAPDTGRIYVTNRGGRLPREGDTTAPSSGTQVVTDQVTGSSTTGTLSVVEPESLTARAIEVGLQPSAVVVSPDSKTVVVANSHSDSISLIETATNARSDVKVPPVPEGGFGSLPSAVAFAADGRTLFVATSGNNAVTVLQPAGRTWKVVGAVPAGYFPSAVLPAQDGSLRVLNIKGVANTDNHKGAFNSRSYEGSLLRIPAPGAPQLAAGLREVAAANAPVFEPSGGANLASLPIHHIVLIVKENRTYDQVLGDIAKGNGDPKLTMYGRPITPNHHALAESFVLLDNFHTGGAISFDGHQWLMQGIVSDYVERAFAASPRGYAWNMSDSLVVSPSGFFWQGVAKPISLRIYGEFQLPARFDPATAQAHDMNEGDELPWREYWRLYKEGKWRDRVGARSGVPALQPYCSRSYPHSTLAIPDQIRAEDYLLELKQREQSGDFPQLSVLTLNSDHTEGTNPRAPTPKAMVADNDLALGRIMEALSQSRFWKTMLVLVVEDDAQDGVDHVDGHRTVALAAGPYVRRNVVDSNHYNHTSMIRTIQDLLRVPPRTRFLKAARPMQSIFTAQPDATPYKCLTPEQPLDQMNPTLKTLSGRKLWAARKSMEIRDGEIDNVDSAALNRILWWDAKGYEQPYPETRRGTAR